MKNCPRCNVAQEKAERCPKCGGELVPMVKIGPYWLTREDAAERQRGEGK